LPGVKAKRSIEPTPEPLMAAIDDYRARAVKAARNVERMVALRRRYAQEMPAFEEFSRTTIGLQLPANCNRRLRPELKELRGNQIVLMRKALPTRSRCVEYRCLIMISI
jgi:hypothetical protein